MTGGQDEEVKEEKKCRTRKRMNVLKTSRRTAHLAWTYLSITRESRNNAPLFSSVETYCMFLGYPRSGHSIIGAVLDAHPQAVIAHEMDALKYIHLGFDRLRLYHLLLQNAQASAEGNRRSGKYVYAVPGQWQGQFDCIRVIGDKRGGGSIERLQTYPWLLQRLRKTVGVPVKFVHVVRNPFDNITTIASHAARGRTPDIAAATRRYFMLCETIRQVKEQVGAADVIEFRHETFIENPVTLLRDLCLFLGLEPASEYLQACAGIVYASPHKSRDQLLWSPDLRRGVEQGIEQFSFLRGYTFEE